MRLIDEDLLIERIYEYQSKAIDTEDVIHSIKTMPTAYDVEKVVAELEIAKEKVAKEDYCRTKHYIENDCEHKDCFKCCAEYLIGIVRKGGVE